MECGPTATNCSPSDDLLALENYITPTLSITNQADEEMVADIFVRVNSKSQALGQDDFIMTLPEGFENMDYEEFLAQRHVPMAQLVKDGFEKL